MSHTLAFHNQQINVQLEQIAQAFDAKRTGPHRYRARCPAHNGRSRSLAISAGSDGRTLIHCFAGCSPASILAAVGLTFKNLYPDGPLPTPAQRRQAAEERKRLEAEARQRRRAHRAACDRLRRLEAVASEWAERLMRLPDGEGDEATPLFHRVIDALHAAEEAEEKLR